MFDRVASAQEPLMPPGKRKIHPVIHNAILANDVPHEVKRLLFECQGIDPVEGATDARLLLRSLNVEERDPDTPQMRQHAFRVAARQWQRDMPSALANYAAKRLVQIMEEWADAELDAVI